MPKPEEEHERPAAPPEPGALTRRAILVRAGKAGLGLSLLPTFAALAACGGSDEAGTASTAAASSTGAADTATDAATTATAAEFDELRWALADAPGSLDVSQYFSSDAMVAMFLIQETLLTYSPTNELVPLLADVTNPTPEQYVFTLRDGITFQDGTPLTVEDVIFSIDHMRREGSQTSYLVAGISTMEETGTNELTITLEAVNPVFAYGLVTCPIIPKAFAEAKGDSLGKPGGVNWIGTGPYKVETFDSSSLVVVRYDDYWDTPPPAGKVTFSFIPDAQARQLAVRSGQIDGTFEVELGGIEEWKALEGINVLTTEGLGIEFLAFNVEAEPWSDIHVRKACAHALNRDAIIEAVYHGAVRPANVMVPPNEWAGFLTNEEVTALYESLPAYPYDLELAKSELAQSSVPDGFSTTLKVRETEPDLVTAMLAYAADLEQIGIKLEVEAVPLQAWLDYVYGHVDLGLTSSAYGPDYPDPSNYLAISYDSAQAVEDGFNTANYKNPEVDRLLAEQNETLDPAVRAAALSKILEIGQQDLPYLNLWYLDRAAAASDKYVVADYTPLTPYYTAWADKVTLA